MHTKIQKWGNSLAVRIPKKLTRELSLEEGDRLMLHTDENSLTLEAAPPPIQKHKKEAWRNFVLETDKKKKENVSGNVKKILYG